MWLGLLVALGLALRLHHISDHGLFVDEIYSVLVATDSGDPELLRFDASRPVYFWLLKFWLLFGQGEIWLRLLSTIFGLANIVLVYKLAQALAIEKSSRNFARDIGLVAALITAFSPMEIHYSQQVRMYTLGSFLVLSGCLALIKAYVAQSKRWLATWGLARLLMVLTLPLTALIFAVDFLFVLSKGRTSKLLKANLLILSALIALWSPFLLIILQAQASPYDSWRATLDAPDLYDYLNLLVNFTASAIPLQECGGLPAYDLLTSSYVIAFPLVLLTGVVCSNKNPKLIWPLLWGLAPLTVLFLWSNLAPPLFITRYSMFTAPFVYLLLAAGAVRIGWKNKIAGAILGAVYALGMANFLDYYYKHPVHEDWRAVCNYLTKHERPRDRIVVWNYHSKYLLGYYYHGKNKISDVLVNHQESQEQGQEEKEALEENEDSQSIPLPQIKLQIQEEDRFKKVTASGSSHVKRYRAGSLCTRPTANIKKQ